MAFIKMPDMELIGREKNNVRHWLNMEWGLLEFFLDFLDARN